MAKLIPLLADLNVSPLTVEALQREGWDIVRISQRQVLPEGVAVTIEDKTVRVRKLPIR